LKVRTWTVARIDPLRLGAETSCYPPFCQHQRDVVPCTAKLHWPAARHHARLEVLGARCWIDQPV